MARFVKDLSLDKLFKKDEVVSMLVDVHTHIGYVKSFAWNLKGYVLARLEDLLDYMNTVGVDWVIVLSTPGYSDQFSRIVSNEKLLKVVGSDSRLVPFCAPDPHFSKADKMLEKLVKMGCKGLGEFKVDLKIDDERVLKVLEKADELGLPVLFHMEDDKYFYDIDALDRILERFRNSVYIGHGPGWWKHISGIESNEAYPKGNIVKEGKLQELLRKHDSIYADISATSGLNALKRDIEHAKKFLVEFQDKILLGTDFPCLAFDGSQFGPNMHHINFLKSLELPSSVLEKILYKNAEKIIEKVI